MGGEEELGSSIVELKGGIYGCPNCVVRPSSDIFFLKNVIFQNKNKNAFVQVSALSITGTEEERWCCVCTCAASVLP